MSRPWRSAVERPHPNRWPATACSTPGTSLRRKSLQPHCAVGRRRDPSGAACESDAAHGARAHDAHPVDGQHEPENRHEGESSTNRTVVRSSGDQLHGLGDDTGSGIPAVARRPEHFGLIPVVRNLRSPCSLRRHAPRHRTRRLCPCIAMTHLHPHPPEMLITRRCPSARRGDPRRC